MLEVNQLYRRVRELSRRYNQLYPGVNSVVPGDEPVDASGEPVIPSGELVIFQAGRECPSLSPPAIGGVGSMAIEENWRVGRLFSNRLPPAVVQQHFPLSPLYRSEFRRFLRGAEASLFAFAGI